MTFGRRMVAAAVCVPLLAAGGCADDPKPKVAPPSATPTSASPTPTPASQPWEKKTNAGAVAFAKHWMATFSTAMNRGDSEPLRAISATKCRTCAAVAERIDAIEAGGGYYSSPGWSVLQAVPSEGTPPGEAILALRILQGKEEFKEKASSPIVRNPTSRATYEGSLEWSDDGWRMSELRLLT